MRLGGRALASMKRLRTDGHASKVHIRPQNQQLLPGGPFPCLISHRTRKPVEASQAGKMQSDTEFVFKFDAKLFKAPDLEKFTTSTFEKVNGPRYTVNAVDVGRTDALQILVNVTLIG